MLFTFELSVTFIFICLFVFSLIRVFRSSRTSLCYDSLYMSNPADLLWRGLTHDVESCAYVCTLSNCGAGCRIGERLRVQLIVDDSRNSSPSDKRAGRLKYFGACLIERLERLVVAAVRLRPRLRRDSLAWRMTSSLSTTFPCARIIRHRFGEADRFPT